MEKQLEKNMENEVGTGIVYRRGFLYQQFLYKQQLCYKSEGNMSES